MQKSAIKNSEQKTDTIFLDESMIGFTKQSAMFAE